MPRDSAKQQLRKLVSKNLDVEGIVEGIAKILDSALSNGEKREIIPTNYESIEEQRYMSMMIKLGMLKPTHKFDSISLRYEVQEKGILLHREFTRQGYYGKHRTEYLRLEKKSS